VGFARLPTLETLRLLVAVVETGSITGGADELGISQQAASRRIGALEADLGRPLFDRSAQGSQPTSTCRDLAQEARHVLDAADRLAERIDRLTGVAARPLRIAASLTIAEHLVPRWLMALRRGDPDAIRADVELHPGNSESVAGLVRAGVVDLGFVETTDRPAGLAARQIADDELVVVVAPTHPWAQAGRRVSVDDLATTPLVMRERGSGTRRALETLLDQRGIPELASPVLELPASAAVRAAIADGAGPGVLSLLAVDDDLRLGRLVRISLDGPPLMRPLTALRRPGSTLSPAARSLLRVASGAQSRAGIPARINSAVMGLE